VAAGLVWQEEGASTGVIGGAASASSGVAHSVRSPTRRPGLPYGARALLTVNFRQPRVLVIHWFRL
jgi:hypothetical protein